MSTAIDVNAVKAFGTEQYVFKRRPLMIGIVLVGVGLIALSRTSDTRSLEGVVLGSLFAAFGLFALARAYYRQAHPLKPVLELSAEGILLRIKQDKEFRIPWAEVQDLGQADIKGKGFLYRDVTVALVSQFFFDANVPLNSSYARSSLWRYFFLPKGDLVQVALHHDILSVSADALWAEIDARWRAFRGEPRMFGRPHRWGEPKLGQDSV